MPPTAQVIRFMKPEEESILKSWRKLDKECDEFVYCWSRWKKWQEEPPIVAVVKGQIVGYHGASFTKSGYVNSASQFVLQEFRGRRLAGEMIGLLLRQANTLKIPRLRFRTPLEGDGLTCWTGLGAVPFGKAQGDYWFDLCIQGIRTIGEFVARANTLHLPPTGCKRRLGYYRRANVEPLLVEYEGVLLQ